MAVHLWFDRICWKHPGGLAWQAPRLYCHKHILCGVYFYAIRGRGGQHIYPLHALLLGNTGYKTFGDNFEVIQSAGIPKGELKAKHIAISYHFVRKAMAAKIVNAHWCKSAENFADICTKALGTDISQDIVTMSWLETESGFERMRSPWARHWHLQSKRRSG
jgi:hypothetical protein